MSGQILTWAMSLLLALANLVPIGSTLGAEMPSDAASTARRAGDPTNAAALATQSLRDTSLAAIDRARLLVPRGLAREAMGERDGALIDFTDAIGLHALPIVELSQAFFARGVTLDKIDRTADAVGDYSAAIRLDPVFAAALNNRANAYRRTGQLAQARADYEASIAAGNPRLEFSEFGLGEIAEAMGQRELALSHYRAALAADSQFTLASERPVVLHAKIDDAPIILRPPQRSDVPALSADPSMVHLRRPSDGVVHLLRPVRKRDRT